MPAASKPRYQGADQGRLELLRLLRPDRDEHRGDDLRVQRVLDLEQPVGVPQDRRHELPEVRWRSRTDRAGAGFDRLDRLDRP